MLIDRVSRLNMAERELLKQPSIIISHYDNNFSFSRLIKLTQIWPDTDSRAISMDWWRDLNTLTRWRSSTIPTCQSWHTIIRLSSFQTRRSKGWTALQQADEQWQRWDHVCSRCNGGERKPPAQPQALGQHCNKLLPILDLVYSVPHVDLAVSNGAKAMDVNGCAHVISIFLDDL